jgi:hypothetical protein
MPCERLQLSSKSDQTEEEKNLPISPALFWVSSSKKAARISPALFMHTPLPGG